MRNGVLFAALSALTLGAPAAHAQAFGPDTSAAAIPADSGGSIVIAPQNNGTTTYTPANPGESAPAATSHSVVVTNGPAPGGTGTGTTGSLGTNGILPDDDDSGADSVPDVHLVRRGDTLWDLCNHYYQNPWAWPKVWSYNPQIANPHWIYPGDQVRLTNPNDANQALAGRRPTSATIGGAGSLINRRPLVPKDTVFLRDQGFLGDPKRDVWGELIGSDEEQMMLTEGNHVVLIFRPGVSVSKGQELTIFNSIRQPQDVPGARKPPGEIVAVRGTVRVLDFDPDTRMAKGLLTDSNLNLKQPLDVEL